eukprot:3249903-Pleurochrysis_carterae.AAC.1
MGDCEDGHKLIKHDGVTTEVYCVFDGFRGIDTLLIENGEKTFKHTDANSCPPGTDIWVPRTKTVLQKVLAKYGSVAQFVGIYGEKEPAAEDGSGDLNCGGCQTYAMHSGEPAQAAFWTSVGPKTGGPAEPWFMRELPWQEPNGENEPTIAQAHFAVVV